MSPRFVFCTTCRDRLPDLAKTLPRNVAQLLADEMIVVLDYNSPDATRKYVTDLAELWPEKIRLYSEQTAKRFRMTHAKNVSHVLGAMFTPQALINLDADNFLTADYLARLRAIDWRAVDMLYPANSTGGFKGRIAVSPATFAAMGGYDEDMDEGYGYDDIDIYRRWRVAKRRVFTAIIDRQSVIPTSGEQKLASQKIPGESIKATNTRHRMICEANLKAKRLVVNGGRRSWGRAVVRNIAGDNIHCYFVENKPGTIPVGALQPGD